MASPDSALNSLGRKGNQSSPGIVWLQEKSGPKDFLSLQPTPFKFILYCRSEARAALKSSLKRQLLCLCAQSLTPLVLADTHLPLDLAQLVSLDLLPEGRVKEQGGGTVVNQA